MAYCHDEGRFQFVCEHFRLPPRLLDLAVASLANSFANFIFIFSLALARSASGSARFQLLASITFDFCGGTENAGTTTERKREGERKRKKSRKSHVPFFCEV